MSVGFDYLGPQQMKNVAAPVASYRVSVGGTTFSQPGSKDGAEPAPTLASTIIGTPSSRNRAGSKTLMPGRFGQLVGLPRSLRAALVIGVFLFLINVFSGLHEIWFHWPAISMLFVAVLWKALRRHPAPAQKDKRGQTPH